MQTVGLCMIVKNESQLILRCLESVRPIVDYVLIEDTGSTDDTQAIIRDWLSSVGLSGQVYDEPWRDFAYNRSHVLAKLRKNQNVDYALMLDADDHIVIDANFDIASFKNNLSHHLYDVELRSGPARYLRPQICSNRLEFRYRGVLHEFLQEPRARVTRGKTTGFYIVSTREGARSQDPEKYRKDAALLEKALQTEMDEFLRSRYTFYLARSYENAGEKELALKAFLRRATLGHWTEEIFMSLHSAGHLEEQLGRPVEEVIARFMWASKVAPTRAEALHAASRVCRENKRFAEGYDYARRGLAIPSPADGLFVVPWIYDYGLLDEFAVNACGSEHYEDCLEACARLLREGKIPAEMRERVENNAHFAREQLTKKQKAKVVDGVGEVDEVFVSLHNAAERLRVAGRPFDEVIAAYDRASDAAPNRAEALHDASRFCRWNNKFAEGYEYAKRGLMIPPPSGGSCVQQWIYDYGLLDELAVNAYWVERYQECLDGCERLLREGKIPSDMRERVKKNAEFAAEKTRLQSDRCGASATGPAHVKSTGIQTNFLFDLLRPERLTAVVDIGANPIDSSPPYRTLLDHGRCRVIGFEPQPAALCTLNARKSELEIYLPHVVGDGKPGVLRVCRASGMTSLFAPNPQVLQNFPGFAEWGQVVEEIPVDTRRLDDIIEIEWLDFLKMDVQGAELSILQNGHERLKSAVAIQTEVSFVPLYKNQPTFGELDLELRRLGFLPHCFVEIKKKLIAPFEGKTPHEGINQLLDADILYTRDFAKCGQMTPEQLKHLAILAHHCYGSFDLAANCIHQLTGADGVPTNALQQYVAALEGAGMR
jgi:FkbM family methyltransferase